MPTAAAAIAALGTVNERCSGSLTGTVVDHEGEGLDPGDLATLTLTIYEEVTSAVINGVENVNILNADRGELASGGALTVELEPDDQECVTAADVEAHLIQIAWTWPAVSPTKAGKKLGRLLINNLALVE